MEQFSLSSSYDEVTIYGTILVPIRKPYKGIIQLVHGMSENRERYYPFMEVLRENGYIAVIHDHLGHGESVKTPDDFGYFYEGKSEALLQDAKNVTAWVKRQYPELPLFLLGHSMGSLVARRYLAEWDTNLDGLILLGPPYHRRFTSLGKAVAKLMMHFKSDHYRSSLLQQLAFGSYQKKFCHESSVNAWICSDQEVVKKYDQSPECGFVFTLNGFTTLFTMIIETFQTYRYQSKNLTLPILVLGGSDDPVIGGNRHFQKTVSFLKQRGYQSVEAKLYPKLRHELLNEIPKQIIYSDIIDWVDEKNRKKP